MGTPSQGAVIATGVLFNVLAITAIVVRIVNNRRYLKTIEIDDWLILPAFILTFTAGVAVSVGGGMGFLGGHSLPMITPEQNAKVQKLSILFFFRRLFRGRAYRTAFDIINWTLITIIILWTIAFLFADAFACGTTPQATWETEWWTEHVCIDTSAMMLACSASNWILDVAILLEPMVIIFNLHLDVKRKLQLSACFLISGFAVVAGLFRMIIWIGVYNHGVKTVTLLGNKLSTGDLQAVATMAVIWTETEIGVAFLVASLLPASKLFDMISFGPIMFKIRSLGSSIRLGSRRTTSHGGSSTPEKDIEAGSDDGSKDSSSSIGRKVSIAHMRYWDREMASINGMASNITISGDHNYLGNYSEVTANGAKTKGEARVSHEVFVSRESTPRL